MSITPLNDIVVSELQVTNSGNLSVVGVSEEDVRRRNAHSMTGCGKNRQAYDFYPTPRELTLALLELEEFEGNIWECATGEGHISKVLEEKYPDSIISSDIREGCYGNNIIDFLLYYPVSFPVDNIITNPPYKYATEFILRAKEVAEYKIAFLLKLNALAGLQRYEKVWSDRDFPLKKVIIFVSRPDFMQKNSPTLEYCWCVWDKYHLGSPTIEWYNNSKGRRKK